MEGWGRGGGIPGKSGSFGCISTAPEPCFVRKTSRTNKKEEKENTHAGEGGWIGGSTAVGLVVGGVGEPGKRLRQQRYSMRSECHSQPQLQQQRVVNTSARQ